MARAFTQYWKSTEPNWQHEGSGLLNHAASDQFRARGVRPGDKVFIVTVIDDQVHLGGAILVDKIVGLREARKAFGKDIWGARDHIVALDPQRFHSDLRIPMSTVRALRFSGNKALLFTDSRKLDSQTLRGVRELTDESADRLDELLAAASSEGVGRGPSRHADGTEELAAIRKDPKGARALFDIFFESVTAENRHAWEVFLADAIEYAAGEYPDRWVLALHRNHVRFIVGMVLCLQFDPRYGATVLVERTAAPRNIELSESEYKYAPGCREASIPFSDARDVISRIRQTSRDAMDICGRAHGGTGSFRGAHSPGVLRYLEEVLGRKLPNPSYAVEGSPGADKPALSNAAEAMSDHPFGDEWSQDLSILDDPALSSTEKEAVIMARRGQGLFRANVLGIEPRCRVTGVTDPNCLIASHIKPWSDSTNSERMSAFNGLMLAPHVDHLFDGGFISFTDNGDLLVSARCSAAVLEAWGISPTLNVGPFLRAQRPFLDYHRQKYGFSS